MSIKKAVIGGSVFVVVAIIIGLVASSLKKLSTEEAALQYDVHQRTLKDKVFRAGLHMGPPGFEFIVFPRVYSTISFGNLRCLNKDGLEISLKVQFQYLASLTVENLKKLVMEFEDHDRYKEVIIETAEEVIHDTCSLFNVNEFQTRVKFEEAILANLHTRLSNDLMTTVRDVQVSNIERPHDYETVVVGKESAKQNINVAAQERSRILTAAQTKKLEAETHANITLNKANTDARITIAKAEAEAKAIYNAYVTEAETYKLIMDNQNLTIDGLLAYLTTRAIQTVHSPVHVNLEAPANTKFP